MTTLGLDYAWTKPPIIALLKGKVKFVCRYLSHDSSKNLSRAEADKLTAAGIWVVVVWETAPDRARAGRAAGVADAKTARSQAALCGMPEGRPIYFAVDWDATPAEQARINAYLDGAASVVGSHRVGMYGGYEPLKRALDAAKAAWGWQTLAWSEGRWDERAGIQQYATEVTFGDADVDFNRALHHDYGQWRVGEVPMDELPHMGEVDAHPDVHRPTEPDEEKVLAGLYGPVDKQGIYVGDPGEGS